MRVAQLPLPEQTDLKDVAKKVSEAMTAPAPEPQAPAPAPVQAPAPEQAPPSLPEPTRAPRDALVARLVEPVTDNKPVPMSLDGLAAEGVKKAVKRLRTKGEELPMVQMPAAPIQNARDLKYVAEAQYTGEKTRSLMREVMEEEMKKDPYYRMAQRVRANQEDVLVKQMERGMGLGGGQAWLDHPEKLEGIVAQVMAPITGFVSIQKIKMMNANAAQIQEHAANIVKLNALVQTFEAKVAAAAAAGKPTQQDQALLDRARSAQAAEQMNLEAAQTDALQKQNDALMASMEDDAKAAEARQQKPAKARPAAETPLSSLAGNSPDLPDGPHRRTRRKSSTQV